MLIHRFFKRKAMLYNINSLSLHCVFHGIRFKVMKIGCRDDNQFFFAPTPHQLIYTRTPHF